MTAEAIHALTALEDRLTALMADIAHFQKIAGVTRAVTLGSIIAATEAEFQLAPGSLADRSRTGAIAEARFVACYLARRLTKHSYQSIGNALNRERGTIIHADRRIQDLLTVDTKLAERVDRVKRRLGE